MIVICLEGTHGSGKSELCRAFQHHGFPVLDEGFLDMPEYALHPQSLLMEMTWAASWFQRLLKTKADVEAAMRDGAHSTDCQLTRELAGAAQVAGVPVVIADRSPYSAVYYGHAGELLSATIKQCVAELAAEADIHVVTVHLRTPADLLWRRIQDRLAVEPQRIKLNEGKREWMDATLAWYDQFGWDLTVPNTTAPVSDLLQRVVLAVAARSPRFRSFVLALPAAVRHSAAIQHMSQVPAGTPVRADTRPAHSAYVSPLPAGAAVVGLSAVPGDMAVAHSPTQPLSDAALAALRVAGTQASAARFAAALELA